METKTNRRGFFAWVAGLFAAPVVAKAAEPARPMTATEHYLGYRFRTKSGRFVDPDFRGLEKFAKLNGHIAPVSNRNFRIPVQLNHVEPVGIFDPDRSDLRIELEKSNAD